jgi:hypothetical protein
LVWNEKPDGRKTYIGFGMFVWEKY